MSLTAEEKSIINDLFLDKELTTQEQLSNLLPENVYNMLKQTNNLNLIIDRIVFRPRNPARPYDSMVISKFLRKDFNLISVLNTLTQCITSDFLIFIDFDFIIECTNDKERPLKFEFASKASSMNEHCKITSTTDQQVLMDEFKNKTFSDLLNEAFINHRDLNDYASSGFKPYQLLSLKLYLQLFPSIK